MCVCAKTTTYLSFLLSMFISILNKITPDKFDKLSRELLDLGLESQDVLKRVLLLIFNKALDDSKYSFMYAKLCKVIYDSLARHFEDENTGTKKRDVSVDHSVCLMNNLLMLFIC